MKTPYRNEHLDALRINADALAVLVQQYQARGADRELCGFILAPCEPGPTGTHLAFVPNVASDPHVEYEMDPNETVAVEQYVEDNDMLLLATFHTHPDGGARPSGVDSRHGFGAWQLIVGREDGEIVVRGFLGDFTAEVRVDAIATCGTCMLCSRHLAFAQPMRVNDGYLCTACVS